MAVGDEVEYEIQGASDNDVFDEKRATYGSDPECPCTGPATTVSSDNDAPDEVEVWSWGADIGAIFKIDGEPLKGKYTAPPTPGEDEIVAVIEDKAEIGPNDEGTRNDAPVMTDGHDVTVVAVDHVEYDGEEYGDGDTIVICCQDSGTATLTAISSTPGVWPSDEPQWDSASSPGPSIDIPIDQPSSTAAGTDYTVSCGTSEITVTVVIIRIDELTGTLKHSGNLIPQYSLTVGSVTGEQLGACPSNTVELSVATTPSNLPSNIKSKLLFTVTGTGASPSSGNFGGGNPTIDLGDSASLFQVRVGCDENDDGLLQTSEHTHGFTVWKIDMENSEIFANRTSAPVESSFPVKDGEHYETGGTFKWDLKGGLTTEDLPMNWEIWDTGGFFNQIVRSGPGNAFTLTLSSSDEGDRRIRFYCDANGNVQSNSGEEREDVDVWVQERKVYNFDVETSDLLGPISHASVQSWFTNAENLVLRKDSEADWRAPVQFNVISTNQFAHGPNRPDPVDAHDNAEMQKHFSATDVTFVDNLLNATGRVEDIGVMKMVLDWNDANANTLAHEIGHGVGLTHDQPNRPPSQIMYHVFSQTKDELREDDVDNFAQ